MNVEIGAEAALFPEKEYINGIAVAVHPKDATSRGPLSKERDIRDFLFGDTSGGDEIALK